MTLSDEIYMTHLGIIKHHFPNADNYNQHIAAKKAAIREVESIMKANPIIPLQFMIESEALDAAREHWATVLNELGKF